MLERSQEHILFEAPSRRYFFKLVSRPIFKGNVVRICRANHNRVCHSVSSLNFGTLPQLEAVFYRTNDPSGRV